MGVRMIVWLLALALAQDAPPAEEVTPPTEEVTPPTEEVAAPTEEVVAPAEDVSSPTDEEIPPTEDVSPPTEEDVPPTAEVAAPTEEVAPSAEEPAPAEPEVAEITVWGDLAVQRARTVVIRDMEALGYKKRKEQDGAVVFAPPSSWMGKAYLDYDGNLSFGRPLLGLQKAELYQDQAAAEGPETNPNLSRSPGGLADPNGGGGYVLPHPTGSFWLLPSRRLLESTQQRVIERMASSLEGYREVVFETRKRQ